MYTCVPQEFLLLQIQTHLECSAWSNCDCSFPPIHETPYCFPTPLTLWYLLRDFLDIFVYSCICVFYDIRLPLYGLPRIRNNNNNYSVRCLTTWTEESFIKANAIFTTFSSPFRESRECRECWEGKEERGWSPSPTKNQARTTRRW